LLLFFKKYNIKPVHWPLALDRWAVRPTFGRPTSLTSRQPGEILGSGQLFHKFFCNSAMFKKPVAWTKI